MAASWKRENGLSILDIRRNEIGSSILDDLQFGLRPVDGGEKTMPTMLLYDEKGLKLFENITYLEEYYLTNAEIDVLERYADQIADRVQAGSQMIELGSGNLRKVNILLQALERAKKEIDYYALDLSLSELQRTLSTVPPGTYQHVRCHGLYGTYDDGLRWLKKSENDRKPKCVLSLGSSIGNFTRKEAAAFLRNFTHILGPQDLMMVGIDGCQDKERVFHAYNDKEGVTHEFVRNGLAHANNILGREAFMHDDWEILGEYDVAAARHQAFYVSVKEIEIDDVHFDAGERVRIEESYKFSPLQTEDLWQDTGVTNQATFGDSSGTYHVHLISKPKFNYPLKPQEYAPGPVPTIHEFEQLWAAWDTVTKHMIPQEELLSKPIDLRNCCLFYLGHIPTFLDIHLTRATNQPLTEPSSYTRIFERGIDPDVDNPELCHAHSEIPDSWPPVEEIFKFQEDVRERTRQLYKTGWKDGSRNVGRALWLGFEHEAMHLETLLYMLLQSDKTLPPSKIKPAFEAVAHESRLHSVPNDWIEIPSRKLSLGMNDPDDDSGPTRYFGWDNEKPIREVFVPRFQAKARPITNEDYARYLSETRNEICPASWSMYYDAGNGETDGSSSSNGSKSSPNSILNNKAVKTVYGMVSLANVLDWPVMASYDELAGCAKWMNGRVPTMEEARSLYIYADELKAKDAEGVLNGTIPAVNSHLSNEGVEESPPSHPCRNGDSTTEYSPSPEELFANLEGCNVGFKHFHPTAVTQNGNKLSGQCDFGGVWEWTSSVLEKQDSFRPMPLYPGYTADFFDGKHNIVLGGSWATHPRIAGRKTFINWYQRNYPYVWAGARVVRNT